MSINVINRRILHIPRYDMLPIQIKKKLIHIQSTIDNIPDIDLICAKHVSDQLFNLHEIMSPNLNMLKHPLSDYARHTWTSQDARWEPSQEYNSAVLAKNIITAQETDCKRPFRMVIEEVAFSCGIQPSTFRKVNVFTKPDNNGNVVCYPDYCEIDEAAGHLGDIAFDHNAPSIWRGICILSGILNIHPFMDGNGRVSRACFNAIIGKPYFPLWAIWACSFGGFQLSLRAVEIHNDWSSIIKYVDRMVEFYKSIIFEEIRT